jgi:hypothetical protein
MIDQFALALTHGLLALAAWRLLRRDDLDRDMPGGAGSDKDERPRRQRPAADA